MELGEVDHEKEVLESRKQTVHPHSTWNINIPEDHISKMHTEKAVLLHNCLYIRSIAQNSECSVIKEPFYLRLFILKNGVIVEIGKGYNVGPGHGLIVYEIGGEPRVSLFLTTHENYPILDRSQSLFYFVLQENFTVKLFPRLVQF